MNNWTVDDTFKVFVGFVAGFIINTYCAGQ